MKPMKLVSSITNVVLYAVLITLAIIVIYAKMSGGEPNFFGYEIKTVLSGSMEPSIQTGSIIAVKPVSGAEKEKFQKGDVITYMEGSPDTLVTHRILEVQKKDGVVSYITKGDNNEEADIDPVWSKAVVAKYSGFTIPYVGSFVNFAQSKEGGTVMMGVPALLLIFYSFSTIKGAIREKKTQKGNEETPTTNV